MQHLHLEGMLQYTQGQLGTADLCRNMVILYTKKLLITCLLEIPLLRQKITGILCDMSRMRTSAFRQKHK